MSRKSYLITLLIVFVMTLLGAGIESVLAGKSIQTGEITGCGQTCGKPMWSLEKDTTGIREFKVSVVFKEPFSSPPEVITSLGAIDAGPPEANIRVSVYAKYITKKGFILVFRTNGDSKVYSAKAVWLAQGY